MLCTFQGSAVSRFTLLRNAMTTNSSDGSHCMSICARCWRGSLPSGRSNLHEFVNRGAADMSNEGSSVLRHQLSLPRPYIAPRNSSEEVLAQIWCRALNMDCVGVEDEFTDLGGD